MKRKIISILVLILFEIIINTKVQAKYVFDNKFDVANLNIDRVKPKVSILSINDTNTYSKNYSNKTHTIEIMAKFTDENLDKVLCDKEHIKFKIGDNYVENPNTKFEIVNDANEEKVYKITLNNVTENGKLKLEISNGTAIDESKLENDKKEIETNIIIDNVVTIESYDDNKISNGKEEVHIKTKSISVYRAKVINK